MSPKRHRAFDFPTRLITALTRRARSYKPSDAVGRPETGGFVTCIQFVPRELPQVATGAFAGDVFRIDALRSSTSAFGPFGRICEILGFPTSSKKDQRPSNQMALLGANVSLRGNHVLECAMTDRAGEIKAHIAQSIAPDCITPDTASKLRGIGRHLFIAIAW